MKDLIRTIALSIMNVALAACGSATTDDAPLRNDAPVDTSTDEVTSKDETAPAPETKKSAPKPPAAKDTATPKPAPDGVDEVMACIDRCGEDLECMKACADAFEDRNGGDDDDDDDDDRGGGGEGRGGDASCCTADGRMFVCHATGNAGASCNANRLPAPNCEHVPARDAQCR